MLIGETIKMPFDEIEQLLLSINKILIKNQEKDFKNVVNDSSKIVSNTDFHRYEIFYIELMNYKFSMCSFRGSFIENSEFINCEFSDCSFLTTIIFDTRFINCKFNNCIFMFAELNNITIENCFLQNCYFRENWVNGEKENKCFFLKST